MTTPIINSQLADIGDALNTQTSAITTAFNEGVEATVNNWLDEHPEATTTVTDGAITEAKLADSLKNKVINDYVTPQMYGAKADGMHDDTSAFESAIASGMSVVVPEGNYKLTEHIFSDESIVIRNSGTYVDKALIVSKVIKSSTMSALNMEPKELTTFGLKGVQGVTFNTLNRHLLLSSHLNANDEPALCEVDFENWQIVNTVSNTSLGHVNDLTFNPNTNKYYCTPMANNGEILPINADLSVGQAITIDGIADIPRQISYDEINDIYYIGTNNGVYVVDSQFTVIKILNTDLDKLNDYDYSHISGASTQGSVVYDGQYLEMMWLLGADKYPSFCRLGSYNYVTGKSNRIYDYFTIGTYDEPEAVVEIDGELYVFGRVITKLTIVKLYAATNTIDIPKGNIDIDITTSDIVGSITVDYCRLSGSYPDWVMHIGIKASSALSAGTSFSFKINPDMQFAGVGLGWSGSAIVGAKIQNGNLVNCRVFAGNISATWSADLLLLVHSYPIR